MCSVSFYYGGRFTMHLFDITIKVFIVFGILYKIKLFMIQ